MNEHTLQNYDGRFLTGLFMGSVVGAGLAMWLAPRAAAEIKERASTSVKNISNAASARYQDVKLRVTDAVDGITRQGQGVRDGMCDAVVRGAEGVEHGAQEVGRSAQNVQRYATEAKTHPV